MASSTRPVNFRPAPYLHTGVTLVLASLASAGPPVSPQPGLFSETASSAGLDFVHFNGMSGEFYLPEIMGSGAALFDYDGDGDLDVYMVQGSMLGPGKMLANAMFPPPTGTPLTDRLFRNELQTGTERRGSLRFTDVTASSGIKSGSYGMGVATGDFDNDGRVDIYVTGFGKNRLLHNDGEGRFTDVTDRAGVGDPGWGVSAAFLDYDRDGWLDLYVGNYVRLNLKDHKPCHSPSSAPDYCTPQVYPAQRDRLYRNRGDGSFEDVSARAGITTEYGAALGVVVADFNRDGWPDVYVANDASPNQLWTNRRNGRFANDAFFAGAAVNMAGAAEGSMGVDAADYDGDGDEDLFMTHLTRETNTLYVNDGRGWFEDRSIAMGLAAPSKAYTGFGTGWLDVDNDGWLDIFTGNGKVSIIRALSDPADPYPLDQPNQLFLNGQGKGFREVSEQAGAAFRRSEISRGAAFGDVDNDGDTDILVMNNNGPARLLQNNVGSQAGWLGLRLIGPTGSDALGARVEVHHGRGTALWRRVRADGSYASASDPRVLVGLDGAAAVERVRVHWPNGRKEDWDDLPINRYTTLRQGTGTAVGGVGDGVGGGIGGRAGSPQE